MNLTTAQPTATGGPVGHQHMLSDAQFSGRAAASAVAPYSQSVSPEMNAAHDAAMRPADANPGVAM